MNTLTITSDGRCAPSETLLIATADTPTANTANPNRSNDGAVGNNPQHNRNKTEQDNGVDHMATGKRPESGPHQRVWRSWTMQREPSRIQSPTR